MTASTPHPPSGSGATRGPGARNLPPGQDERRKHPRVQAQDLLLRQDGGRTPLRVRDISRSGVSFFTEEPLTIMTRVAFTLEFPASTNESQNVSGEGVVVRCEPISDGLAHYEVAVFFSDLQSGTKDLIQNYVSKRLVPGQDATG